MNFSILTKACLLLIILSTAANSQWIRSEGTREATILSFAVTGQKLYAGTRAGVYRLKDINDGWIQPFRGLPLHSAFPAVAAAGNLAAAGTDSGAVYFSSDEGAIWRKSGEGLPQKKITALAILGQKVFAGADSAVYFSEFNGSPWKRVDKGMPCASINALAAGDSFLLAATSEGLFRTTEDLTAWRPVSSGVPESCFAAITSKDSFFLAGTPDGKIFRSIDYGLSWSSCAIVPCHDLRSLAFLDSRLFAGSYDQGVFVSTNNGDSWSLSNNFLYYTSVTAMASIKFGIFAGTDFGGGVFVCRIFSDYWQRKDQGMPGIYINGFASMGSDLFAATNTGGVIRSTDNGKTWNWATKGLVSPVVKSITVSGRYLFAGTDYGVSRSSDRGENWKTVSNGLSNLVINAMMSHGTDIFAGNEWGRIWVSSDYGSSWKAAESDTIYMRISDFAALPGAAGNDCLFTVNPHYIYKSTDNGRVWKRINQDIPIIPSYCLEVMGDELYSGSWYGIYMSQDRGENWKKLSSPKEPFGIVEFKTFRENIFVSTHDSAAFLTTDRGKEWKKLKDDEPMGIISSFEISGDYLVAGTYNNGIWRRPLSEIITAVKEENPSVQPDGFHLDQNYPNPFNPSTTISYSIPQSGYVELKVYDIMGREIRKLVNGYKPAGRHTVVFYAGGLSGGVYIYMLRSGGRVLSGKLCFMK